MNRRNEIKSVIDEALDNVDKYIESKQPPSKAPSRSSSPVKSGGDESKQPDDDGYDSDETLPEAFTPATLQIPYYTKAYKILTHKAIVKLEDKTKADTLPGTIQADLDQLYFQIHGTQKTYKTLRGYRNNLLVKNPNVLTPTKKKNKT